MAGGIIEPPEEVSMKPLRIPLRIVFYKEEGDWIAHCLEFDVCGDGTTKAEALESLSEAIRIQVEKSIEFENFENLFAPASPEIFGRFAAGSDVAEGELKLHIAPQDSVVIQDAEYREYSEEAPGKFSGRDLVSAS